MVVSMGEYGLNYKKGVHHRLVPGNSRLE